jgi:anti-sigma-K factor RskA
VQTSSEAANALMGTLKDASAVHATLTAAETHPLPSGRVTYVADKGSLIFIASNLAPLDPAKTYELWVIPSDGSAAMPAGLFKPDDHGYASVVMPDLPKGVEAKAFGITIENAGGSLTPTAPVILKGTPS